ncbi:MAG: efflux RND transporter periplasmic adaptor subunit [Opitutaceae bacterium]|nr:efflux RND transporter periplasmic adaptor subunit [Opitutaceae bacterium]
MAPDKHTLDALKIHRPASAAGSRGPMMLGVVAVAALIGAAIWWFYHPKAIEVQTASARAITASAGDGARTLLNASGYVTARRAATVSSKVTGRVIDVLVEEGMKVEEGQVLAHLDSSNVAVNLRLAEAQLEAARQSLGETEANLVLAQKNFERSTNLAEAKVVSASDLDRAVAELAALQARLARQRSEILVAEQQVATWKQQIDDTVIRAPFAGIVTSKNAQQGEMISPISAGGGFTRTGICTLVDMNSLEVEVDVNEAYINRVSPGQPVQVTLDAYPDWRIPAKVIAIIPAADRQKATVRVRVGFEALDPRILPDMGLKVAFQEAEPPAGAVASTPGAPRTTIVVPSTAVRRAGDRDVVWVVRNGRVERRAVNVGMRTGDETTIAAGLTGGERVVIQGPDTLADGARVAETSH